jgi:hypothetical protein
MSQEEASPMKRTLVRFRLAALVLPLLAMTSAGCDIALADFKAKQSAEWKKTYELAPGGRFELANVNGRIVVEPSAGNSVEVVAEKIAKAASDDMARQALARVQIQESVSDSTIRIETKYAGSDGLFNRSGHIEVRYRVRVPASADVKFTTVNGGVEISGLTGRTIAETTNGGIKALDIGGPIEATTTNGGVEVDLAQVAEGGVKLECTNGGISLRLPRDAKATIRASVSNGGIDADGLDLATSESSRRRLEGRLNGGGPRIDIEGTNGGIDLRAR